MKLISLALILTLLLLGFNTETVSILISGDAEAWEDLSHGSMVMLLFFTLVLMTIHNTFPVIPLVLLISINVSVFGFTLGYFWSLFISLISATVAFIIARYWFQSFFDKYVDSNIKEKIERRGFWYVFLGRIFPVIPSSVTNIAAGVSSVRYRTFLYATLIGNMVYFFLLALITQGIFSIQLESYLLVVIAALLLLAYAILRLWKRKQVKKGMTQDKLP